MEIYSDESSKSGVSYVESFEEETIGVGIEFTVSI